MARTLQVQLSDAAIRKHAASLDVGELKDPRYPLRFRYRRDRSRGSWHVIHYGKGARWRKAGNWPDVSARLMLDSLPAIQARLLGDPTASAAVDSLELVGQVLDWYVERVAVDRSLSERRRSGIRSAIRKHLRPRLGELRLAELNKARLDDALYLPMQSELSMAHVKAVFGVLKLAFRRALRLGLITVDPLALIAFSDFNKAKIRPKGARLRHVAVPALLAAWAELFESAALDVAFAVLMLCCGTRIGETRVARWVNVDLLGGEWFIPAHDVKSRRDHVVPLTPQLVAFLSRYREWQAARGYAGAFLFPASDRSGKPLSRSASFDIFHRLGAGEWTSHDLRKLARTSWAELGVDSLIGKLLLNHALPDLDSTYVQTNGATLKRAALERWHAWLDARGFDLLHDKTAARRAAGPTDAQAADWLIFEQ
ncbi:tyrosine-type recombinase/integrase [Pseudomonas aeruginosa]|uniref:tyrosine-type recombinase/integrase n=1 Tax=Pseudomonas aeruginosa TaxID=287 RepID=UPI00227B942C|nr:site-specific integrase [Pseudomonas aeruginosa]WAJ88603.1 site-specific integrase [Pseudomonas aeruginosa]